MGSCDTPGVPLCELRGRQPSITRCDGSGEPRAGQWEEDLETHEAASYHSQLSRLHHSPKHNRGGDRKGRVGGRIQRGRSGSIDDCQSSWAAPGENSEVAAMLREWSGTLCGSSSPQRKEERERDRREKNISLRHGLSNASDMRALDKQGSL